MAEETADDKRMPLLAHIAELRNRLIYAIAGFIVAFVVCFYFADAVFSFLMIPLVKTFGAQGGQRMIYTALTEKFFTDLKVAFFSAAFVSFPIVASQIYAFVAPGLYKRERAAFLPYLVATPVMFLLGASLVYYLVLPVAWDFFLSFQQPGGEGTLAIQLEPKVNEYLGLTMQLIFAFGLGFQLPVILTLLGHAGITSAAGLKKNRRYSIVLAFVVAAVLTPPDVLSQISLAVPVIILYEVSIWLVTAIEKRRAVREAEEEKELAGAASSPPDPAAEETDFNMAR